MAVKQLDAHTYNGLAGDSKTTTGVQINSTFWETDTGDTYIYDGTAWVKKVSEVNLVSATGITVTGLDVSTATPTIYNVTLTNANTEYSQALPANCRGFEFQAQGDVAIRFAFVTGKVATPTAPYLDLKAGDYYFSFPLNQGTSPSTLYLASGTAATVVEVLAWT